MRAKKTVSGYYLKCPHQEGSVLSLTIYFFFVLFFVWFYLLLLCFRYNQNQVCHPCRTCLKRQMKIKVLILRLCTPPASAKNCLFLLFLIVISLLSGNLIFCHCLLLIPPLNKPVLCQLKKTNSCDWLEGRLLKGQHIHCLKKKKKII